MISAAKPDEPASNFQQRDNAGGVPAAFIALGLRGLADRGNRPAAEAGDPLALDRTTALQLLEAKLLSVVFLTPLRRWVLPGWGRRRGIIRSFESHRREKTFSQNATTRGSSTLPGRGQSRPCWTRLVAVAVLGSKTSGGAGEVKTPGTLVGMSLKGSDRQNAVKARLHGNFTHAKNLKWLCAYPRRSPHRPG